MKRLLLLMLALIGLYAQRVVAWSDDVLVKIYGAHKTACTATAVDSTNANRVGPLTGYYLVYGYTSATDFTGVAIKCIQGGASVTVNAVAGVKLAAGEKQVWEFKTGATYISCQTGSGTGFYDLCKQE